MKFATIDKAIIIKAIGELEVIDREKPKKIYFHFSNHNFR